MPKVNWNEQGQRYLAPMQRDAFEREVAPKRLDGHLYTDDWGRVWFKSASSHKHVGDVDGADYAADMDVARDAELEGRHSDAKKIRDGAKKRSKSKKK